MALKKDLTPYTTAMALIDEGGVPYLDTLNSQRVLSYQLYEQMYWSVDTTFAVVSRGNENSPLYIPSGRTVCDTNARYVAANMSAVPIDGTDQEQERLRIAFDALFRRERWWSKFHSNKLDGIMRGDWCWHVVANPFKPESRRISLIALDPGSVVKHWDPADPDRVIGVDIIDQVVINDELVLRVLRYQKGQWEHELDYKPPGDQDIELIYSSTSIWLTDEYKAQLWDAGTYDDATRRARVIERPPTQLDDRITALPVYHVPNDERGTNPWGSSSLRGIEVVMGKINQGASDEELALALEGLGLYWTDAAPPMVNGRPGPWRLGPGKVVELPDGKKMDRVNGVSSVAPYVDHLDWVYDHGIKEPTGINDAAMGKVDVNVAESGIALQLRLAPMLANVARIDNTIMDVHRQMWFDLRAWMEVYEPQLGINSDMLAVMEPKLGEKLPVNKDAEFNRILTMYRENVVDLKWTLEALTGLGYDFTGLDVDSVLASLAARTLAADPFAARASGELNVEETP